MNNLQHAKAALKRAKKENVPMAIRHFEKQVKKLVTPYHVVIRKEGEFHGKTAFYCKTMEDARKKAEWAVAAHQPGTVAIIYLMCPSMPLDARYYVHAKDGKIYQSRSRVYTTRLKKLHAERAKENRELSALYTEPPTEDYRKKSDEHYAKWGDVDFSVEYTEKWLKVKELVELYHKPKGG